MEKALKIFYLLIAAGIALYFLPFITGFFGFSSDAVGREGILSVSLDGGHTFRAAIVHAGDMNVYDIERSVTNPSLVYAATDKGLLISKDGGENWYRYDDLEGRLDGGTRVYDILVNPFAPREIFVAASGSGKSVVYATRDNFFTLDPIFDTERSAVQELEAKNGSIYFRLIDGEIVRYSLAEKTFAFESGAGSGVFAGEDAFASFLGSSQSSAGLALAAGAPPKGRITALADKGPLVLLGAEEKLYRSDDYGMHWTISEPVARNRSISVIRISDNGKIVLVGSNSNPLWNMF